MNPSPLVTATEAAERLRLPDTRIVDASWFLPAEGRSGRAEFEAERIPGAVFFDIDAIADPASGLPHMLPSPDAFAAAVGLLGLAPAWEVIVYDTFGVRSAARAWWSLKVMGYARVRVLDGGFRAWKAAGLPVETGPARAPSPVKADIAFSPERVRSLADVAAALASASAQVVDARSAARFRGEAPEPRPGLRAGHMPGAVNLPFDRLLEADGTLKAPAGLVAEFAAAGVDPARPVIASCGSGVTASVLALALEVLGHAAAVYDGSWAEWGGPEGGDVVTGGT
ncbi:MAG: 3-mercaptopyruvate sulfurtransferase [Phenylobacterium sp.]